jgi:hypothetical protein
MEQQAPQTLAGCRQKVHHWASTGIRYFVPATCTTAFQLILFLLGRKMRIGFSPSNYNVPEAGGNISVCATVLEFAGHTQGTTINMRTRSLNCGEIYNINSAHILANNNQ